MCIIQYLLYFWVSYKAGNKKDPCTFGWSERYKVAVGVAEALEYLHTESAKPVIHRDVKSSNILLSEDFEPQVIDIDLPTYWRLHFSCSFLLHILTVLVDSVGFQLSDFGLAKWASTTSSHITCTDVAGTFGFVLSPTSKSCSGYCQKQ